LKNRELKTSANSAQKAFSLVLKYYFLSAGYVCSLTLYAGMTMRMLTVFFVIFASSIAVGMELPDMMHFQAPVLNDLVHLNIGGICIQHCPS
jgi:hypothetical protein